MAIRRLVAVYALILLGALMVSAWRLNELTFGSAARSAWMPFLRPLLGAGFEVSLLLAIAPALLAARTAGLGWVGCAVGFSVLTGLSTYGAVRLDPAALAPGQLAEELLQQARAECEQSSDHQAEVPLIGMRWSCPPGSVAKVTGRSPVGKRAEFSAESVVLAPDLRTIELANAELSLKPKAELREVHIGVKRAVIRGLNPWGRPADVPLGRRLLRAVLAALCTSVAAMWVTERLRWSGKVVVGACLLSGIAAFLAQSWLDRHAAVGPAYAGVVLIGPLGVTLAALARSAIRRFFSRSAVAR